MTRADIEKMGYRLPESGRVAEKVLPSIVAAKSVVAQIRLPAEATPNKTEQRFSDYHRPLWRPALILYTSVRLRLPSGTHYTPDFLFSWPDQSPLLIEVKGGHIHNERSPEAFKAARAAYPHWRFLFAQYIEGEWRYAPDPATLNLKTK